MARLPSKLRSITLLTLAEVAGMSLWFATAAALPDMVREAGISAMRQAMLSSGVQAGFVIGALVSGQMLYNFVLENLRYYAAMKAMGATNGRLVRMVALQVLVVATLGFGIGAGCASASGELLRMGGLAFAMVWQIPVFAAGAVLLACLCAASISIRSVLRLEPAAVFKA